MKQETINGKLYQPIEGIDCQKCAFVNHPDDTCYRWRCTADKRPDDRCDVYYVEVV